MSKRHKRQQHCGGRRPARVHQLEVDQVLVRCGHCPAALWVSVDQVLDMAAAEPAGPGCTGAGPHPWDGLAAA